MNACSDVKTRPKNSACVGQKRETPSELIRAQRGRFKGLAGSDLLSHRVSAAVPLAHKGLTTVFGMGTGGTPSLSPPTKGNRIRMGSTRQDDAQGRQAKRTISTGQLSTLLCLHIRPINLVVYKGPSGSAHLEVGFPLRCFQRLSLPYVATRLCRWRDNRNTRGPSIPVLSY